MGESLEYLKNKMHEVVFDENMFRVYIGEDKYIFGALVGKQQQKGKPDYFAISSIYDSIIDLNKKIQFSFHLAAECNPSESLKDYVMFGNPQDNEVVATYYIENMVFRTQILWDLLAQLYNAFWCSGVPIDKLYAETFFHNHSQGKKAKESAQKIHEYFDQPENIRGVCEPWDGNHEFIKGYRNKLSHRCSPNITTMSSIAFELRPPAMYVLKRATEDYLQAVIFIQNALSEISKCREFVSFKIETGE